MGHCAEWIAGAYQVSRAELDAFSAESHRRAVAAWAAGRFEAEITTVNVPGKKGVATPFVRDECPRPDTDAEALAQLAPVFRDDGCVTAGNASSIADGAAAVVLMRRERARELGLAPLARIVAYDQAAVEPLRSLPRRFSPPARCSSGRGWRWTTSNWSS